MVQDRRLLYLLQRAARAANAGVSARTVERLGVSVTQLGALSYIHEHDGCSMTEVAAALDLNKSATSALIGRLERAELVRREANPNDGRGMRLHLTEKGQRARADAKPVFRRAMAEITDGFTRRELDVVYRFLNELVARFADVVDTEDDH